MAAAEPQQRAQEGCEHRLSKLPLGLMTRGATLLTRNKQHSDRSKDPQEVAWGWVFAHATN